MHAVFVHTHVRISTTESVKTVVWYCPEKLPQGWEHLHKRDDIRLHYKLELSFWSLNHTRDLKSVKISLCFLCFDYENSLTGLWQVPQPYGGAIRWYFRQPCASDCFHTTTPTTVFVNCRQSTAKLKSDDATRHVWWFENLLYFVCQLCSLGLF